MKTAFLALFSLLLCSESIAAKLSLLQNRRGIECKEPSGQFILKIDRHDEKLDIKWKKTKTEVFRTQKFLDTAMEMVSDSGRSAVFHILENGKVLFLVGQRFGLRERNCKEHGASKRCTGPGIKSLSWSSEELKVKYAGKQVGGGVTRYGIFPNDGTYTYAEQKKNAVALIDYGAQFNLFVGEVFRPLCKYLPVTYEKAL